MKSLGFVSSISTKNHCKFENQILSKSNVDVSKHVVEGSNNMASQSTHDIYRDMNSSVISSVSGTNMAKCVIHNVGRGWSKNPEVCQQTYDWPSMSSRDGVSLEGESRRSSADGARHWKREHVVVHEGSIMFNEQDHAHQQTYSSSHAKLDNLSQDETGQKMKANHKEVERYELGIDGNYNRKVCVRLQGAKSEHTSPTRNFDVGLDHETKVNLLRYSSTPRRVEVAKCDVDVTKCKGCHGMRNDNCGDAHEMNAMGAYRSRGVEGVKEDCENFRVQMRLLKEKANDSRMREVEVEGNFAEHIGSALRKDLRTPHDVAKNMIQHVEGIQDANGSTIKSNPLNRTKKVQKNLQSQTTVCKMLAHPSQSSMSSDSNSSSESSTSSLSSLPLSHYIQKLKRLAPNSQCHVTSCATYDTKMNPNIHQTHNIVTPSNSSNDSSTQQVVKHDKYKSPQSTTCQTLTKTNHLSNDLKKEKLGISACQNVSICHMSPPKSMTCIRRHDEELGNVVVAKCGPMFAPNLQNEEEDGASNYKKQRSTTLIPSNDNRPRHSTYCINEASPISNSNKVLMRWTWVHNHKKCLIKNNDMIINMVNKMYFMP